MDTFSLLQWNCQGLRAKYEELKLLIHEFSPLAICLQETMLDHNTPCPREYVSYRTEFDPDVGSHGGCLIYTRRDVPQRPIDINSHLQAIAVQIDLTRKYTLCSLYLPPNSHVSREDLVELIEQLPQPFLLLGDMNSRHPLWGDVLTNPKGKLISTIIENEDIGLLNTGEPTHFHSQTNTLSCIDLSLASSNCLIDFNWRTLDDWHTSDHAPILMNTCNGPPARSPPRWCLNKADWPKFRELSEIEGDVEEFQTIDNAIDFLNGTLHVAGVNSIPKTTGLFRRRPVPWWSEELKTLHRATRTALTRCRRHRTDENVIMYKKCRAQFRRAIKAARRQSWTSFVSAINSRTPPTTVWKKIRKIAGKHVPNPPPVLKVNGQYISDANTVSNVFAEHFANISHKSETAPGNQYRLREEQHILDFSSDGNESYNLPFTEKEYDTALATCYDTAPGPDDITYEMIKQVSANTKLFIISLLNRIWRESVYPSVWELASILAFSKPGKDKSLPANYRPIALTSCLSKIMEKMINVRLVWYLENKGIISPAQCGFRKMHSTTDVLVRLESSICEAFATKQHHVTVFFDLEKAYDTAWRHGILKAIHESGLRGNLALFIKAFLTRRLFQVKVGNTFSEKKCQEEGVPQGCVLSVTLFSLAINGLSSVIPRDILYTLFVDDLSLSFAASKMATAERRLQLSINKIVEWADENGFKFSTSKTVVVHFCRIRGAHPDPDIYLKGQRIPCVEETTFLGLIFDQKLKWVSHLKFLKTKCLEALNILRVLAHTTWGADRQTLLRLYKALILSKLAYGCEIYSSATPNNLKILDSIHHAGIRLATGAFKTSPIPSLLVDAGELPLDLYRQSSLVRYWYRLQRLPSSLAYKAANKEHLNEYYDTHPKSPQPYGFRVKQILRDLNMTQNAVCAYKLSIAPPWKLPSISFCTYFKGFKRDMSEDEIRSIFMEHVLVHGNSTFIYTDGSKSDAGIGYGVSSDRFNQKGALPNIATIFTAELYGILAAVEKIVTMKHTNFTIFSDSKSALQALGVFNPTNPLVLKILQWIYVNNNRGIQIKFCWVPAHVNIAGNERADQLAKSAATELPPRECALPYHDFFPAIRLAIRSVWQQHWDAVGQNKMRRITDEIAPWKYSMMPRRWETALCRLRIGHTRITHSYLMSNNFEPFCDDCLVPLTVEHLLVECPSLGDLRDRHLGSNRGEDGNYSLANVLGKSACRNSGIFDFIVEAGLLHEI